MRTAVAASASAGARPWHPQPRDSGLRDGTNADFQKTPWQIAFLPRGCRRARMLPWGCGQEALRTGGCHGQV